MWKMKSPGDPALPCIIPTRIFYLRCRTRSAAGGARSRREKMGGFSQIKDGALCVALPLGRLSGV